MDVKKFHIEQLHSFRVFPARAGINRKLLAICERLGGVPRASGDKPRAVVMRELIT